MRNTRLMLASLALALAMGELAGCGRGNESGGESASAATIPSADTPHSSCPTAAKIGSVVGFPVRVAMDTASAGTVVCGYQATDPGAEGTFVSITVEPAAQANKRLEEVKSGAKLLLGQSAEAERIDVGERGYAYGSTSKSEAAAVAKGRVYYASIESAAQANIGNEKARAVQLLREMIR